LRELGAGGGDPESGLVRPRHHDLLRPQLPRPLPDDLGDLGALHARDVHALDLHRPGRAVVIAAHRDGGAHPHQDEGDDRRQHRQAPVAEPAP
jgi:hypothetical protein